MNCWICGSSAQTGEHLIKASDMRSIFGHIRQSRPVYLHSASQRNHPVAAYAPPDYALIHQELKRKGVTLQLLWEEYSADHPGGAYRYSQFPPVPI